MVCNKDVGHPGTSQYIGLDVGSGHKTKKITTRFVFEKGYDSGVVAMIFNPLGAGAGTQILEKSVHCILRNHYIRLQLLDNYNVINFPVHYLQNPLPMDGVTEYEASLEVSGNTVTMTYHGETFTENITGYTLSDFYSQYAIFEFYCDDDRNVVSMPEFTYVKLENDAGQIFVEDNFHRPDGVLTVAPNGVPYSLFT